MLGRVFGSLLVACVVLPEAQAQPVYGANPPVGYTHHGYPYGPRVAPPWNYYGLPGGPYVTYPFGFFGPSYPGFLDPGFGDPRVDDGYPFGGYSPLSGYGGVGYPYGVYGPRVGIGIGVGPVFGPGFGFGGFDYPGFGGFGYPYGAFGYPYGGFGYPYGFGSGFFPFNRSPGRAGSVWSNGLSLYGPPVPVYGPIPGVFGNNDLTRQWRSTLTPAFAGYGWVGIYAASPRPHYRSVSVQPAVEPLYAGTVVRVPAVQNIGGCLLISVTVPQPAAEVFVDGKKTTQTGTDRTFESPPLEAGKTYKYTITARWIERGQVVEVSKDAIGTPGEVVRVDFGR
jgi:uncharacterized protein (TIGR03000 family)